MMRMIVRGGTLLLIIAFFGCAKATVGPVIMYWPAPPEEPKIAYVKSYRGESDFVKPSFFDLIFGKPASAPMNKPYGVAGFGDRIYVALSAGASVMVIDRQAETVSYIGGAGGSEFAVPIGIATAQEGTIFVSDAQKNRVFGYDAAGKLKVAIGNKKELLNPAGMAVNNELKRLYVVDSHDHNVKVYSLGGEMLFTFGRRGSEAGEFNFPSNIAVNRRSGNVYVADTQNFRVQVFDKDGKFLKKFGTVGDGPGFFSRPKGIGVDSEGHIYVLDAAFANFQIFDENDQLLLYVGDHGQGPARYLLPAGLSIDDQDRIYITDQLGAKVEVFQYISEKWKKENPAEYKKYLLGGEKPKEESGREQESKK